MVIWSGGRPGVYSGRQAPAPPGSTGDQLHLVNDASMEWGVGINAFGRVTREFSGYEALGLTAQGALLRDCQAEDRAEGFQAANYGWSVNLGSASRAMAALPGKISTGKVESLHACGGDF